ncbi:MAG: PD-(D/E)XK nuclease family protein [Bacteroidota bacterium]|nr:PD-(D/E)XK nuclease family protein [Bacteroidota bacterium]
MLLKSKSIEGIYKEVKDYDLVITNDAPLATALNKLVEAPRFDYFAMTPRQIASKFALLHFGKIYSKAELIVELSKELKKPLKQIHQNIEKIFDVWNNTGVLENCFQFLGGEEKELIKHLEKYATVELAMERFDEEFYGSKKIAVAGIELFNLLDRQVLPKKNLYPDEIKVFGDELNEINKTYLFNSSNDLINQTVSLINKDNENDIAIVMNTESEYLDVIKSRLKENGIGLQIKSYLSEDIQTVNILSFIESAFRISDLRVSNLSYFENMFGINLGVKHNRFYLQNFVKMNSADKRLREINEIMTTINSYTYKRLFESLSKDFKIRVNPELVKVLKALEIYDAPISEDNLNLITYFIRYIDVELSMKRDGVLFVNALNAAFIDRPVVIFAGLDESWTKLNPDKAYISKDEEEKKNLLKFQILLSQGQHKFNFALNIKNNLNVIPCYYFNMLDDRTIKSFEDEYFKAVHVKQNEIKKIYKPQKENLNITKLPDTNSISPTSLNNYVICPKKYSYLRLLPPEENYFFLKGNLLHSFADFYFNQPEYTKENFDKILGYIMDGFRGFVKDTNADAEKTLFRIGMESIMKFLDEKNFNKLPLTGEDEKSNFLFKKTGLKKIYDNTEKAIEENRSRIKGKIDLSVEHIIADYKSSSKRKTTAELLNEFKIELLRESEEPVLNFQTIAYLASKREDLKDAELEFIYNYALADKKNIIGEKVSWEKPETSLKYKPLTFKEYILSVEYFKKMLKEIDKKSEEPNSFLTETGFENYRTILESKFDDINFYELDAITDELENQFHDTIKTLGLSYKHFKKSQENTFRKDILKPVLKFLYNTRIGFSEGIIFKDDADKFLELVNEKINEINEYQNTNFPNRPAFDLREVCQQCEHLNNCIGNKLWS